MLSIVLLSQQAEVRPQPTILSTAGTCQNASLHALSISENECHFVIVSSKFNKTFATQNQLAHR